MISFFTTTPVSASSDVLTFVHRGRVIACSVVVNPRCRRLRLMVRPGGEVRVVVPSGCSQPDIERFVERNVSWIARMVSLARRRPTQQLLPPVSRADFIRLKHRAFDLVKERIIHLNRLYGVSFESIRIGSAVSTWGSCNRNGALRFSYRILFLPPALQDYIIVHELCHRKEFNHGREFWNFVALTVPEYKMIRRQLRTYAG